LEDGRRAVLSKIHHCMVDGIGGNDLMAPAASFESKASRAAWPNLMCLF
jgi:Wax ester synthase-like Acyl-CoA acyltransferase domain